MTTPTALRAQRYRQRQRADQVCLLITVNHSTLADMLLSAGLLDPMADDDSATLARGVERLIELFVEEKRQ
jgi:hypothetical protein